MFEPQVLHRYGLFGQPIKTTAQLAVIMGITRQYVGQLHDRAINKMRESLEKEPFTDLYASAADLCGATV
ncbi:unnamed protein product [Choristocarpus tenellus]